METIIHNFGALDEAGRNAAETLVGHSLTENQQLVIQIVNQDATAVEAASTAADEPTADQLPEWCNVYAGLSDGEIATLEQAISRRLDLTRSGT
jgi:hypothetical protein